MKARTEGEVAAKPLGDLSPFSPSARISFKAIVGRVPFNLLSASGLSLLCLLAPQGNLRPNS